jgi:hypothetical protein
MMTEPLSGVLTGTRQRRRLCRVPPGLALSKGSSSGPHASLCKMELKRAFLPSVVCLPLGKRALVGPTLVSVPSALVDTRQRESLCRLSGQQHSTKRLYRFLGVLSLLSVTLGKVPRDPFLFVFVIPSKQTKDIYH